MQFEAIQRKAEKLRILTEHIDNVQSFPQKLAVPQPSVSGRPFTHVRYMNPTDLFHRFIPKKLFETIAKNTNLYVQDELKKWRGKKGKRRSWQNITASDIGAYIGAISLIGAQSDDRDIPYYWNTKKNLPDWPVAKYISLIRFQQISRYLKINPSGDVPNEEWYQKIEPLASAFRAAITPELYELPQNIGIDEQLIQFSDRSKYIIQMNFKAAGEEYKIYSLYCSNGYSVDFRFTNGEQKVAELSSWPN